MPKNRKALTALIAALAALAAAPAHADTPLPAGSPVANPPEAVAHRDSGLGVPVPDSVALTDLRVADPGGGLPWGLRVLKTTRAMGCAQVGRVQDDQLGMVGQDGAFTDDGLFHPWPAEVLQGAWCTQLDAAGHAFLAVSYQGLPASASPSGCLASANPGGAQPSRPTCPTADERILYYGLLGPQGQSVTYKDDDGRAVTSAAVGPDGAYLVVLRPNAQRPAKGYLAPSTSPVSGLLSASYQDGTVCRLRSPRAIGGGRRCPLVGFQPSTAPRVTAAQIASPVHVHVAAKPHRPQAPQGVQAAAVRSVTVSFRARRASPDARSYYVISLTVDRPRRCRFGTLFGPVARNVRAGTMVREKLSIPAGCRGRVSGSVAFHQQGHEPDPVPFGAPPGHDPLVGRFSAPIRR